MTDLRHNLMTQFLMRHLGDDFKIESLPGDASFRRYHRIYQGDVSYLLMDAPPQKESVQLFVDVAKILNQVVNAPNIIEEDIENGFLLLQDFGEIEFAHLILDKVKKDDYYSQALHALNQLQTLNINDASITSVILPYSDKKYEDEMDLFSEWFLPFIGYVMSDDEQLMWQTFKKIIIKYVQSQPKVVVHRDYHSRNLMQDKASDRLGVIDFQDALIGAYSYDLVSLIRDAYIDENDDWVNQKIKEFYNLADIDKPFEQFCFDVNVMGVQRHLKVLGIFVRLYQRDGKDKYLSNIPKQWQDLNAELNYLVNVTVMDDDELSVVRQFNQWIKKIQSSYDDTFHQHQNPSID